MIEARAAREGDLDGLLALLRRSEVSDLAPPDRIGAIWRSLVNDEGVTLFVLADGDAIVATSTLVTAPNLLRSGRRHGFLENVVVPEERRGQGLGRAAVSAALDADWAAGCHHVMLQSGRADPRVHALYSKLGFVGDLRTAYVVARQDA